MENLQHLLERNARWASERVERDPEFFRRLTGQQSPKYLWIGCSDSRVPANEIVALQPGELFVHRNLANVVAPEDSNCQSVLEFAVSSLRVEHVMVVGHYRCSAVHAALHATSVGPHSDRWLGHLREVADLHAGLLEAEPQGRRREALLCELNVLEQSLNVCRSESVRAAWARGQSLTVHGWIYRLGDGRLRHLNFSVNREEDLVELRRRGLQDLMRARKTLMSEWLKSVTRSSAVPPRL